MYEVFLFFKNLDFNWSWIEAVAVFFSIIYVILASKESIWCWAAAAISVSIYIYICFFAQLYAETGLQIFYLFMAFYGYYNWNKKEQNLQISQWSISRHLLIIIIGSLLTFLIGFYLTTYTNAKMPIVDSFTTVFSVFATYMVTKKILANWLYWIVIDIVSAYLYLSRDLELTALLFMIYTVIAIFGYLSWIKKIKINE
jgi:nicotinamide mononucleotide transporter